MDDFQRAVIETLGKMLELSERSDERLAKIGAHWDRNDERGTRHSEIEERHLYLREKEHAEKFSQEAHVEAVRLVNNATKNNAWTLDMEARAVLRKQLDELDAAEERRQERKAKRDAERTATSQPAEKV